MKKIMSTGIRSFIRRLKSAFLKSLESRERFEVETRQKLDQLSATLTLVRTLEERTQRLEFLARTVDERSRTLEFLARTVDERSRTLEFLARTVDERSQSLEYLARQTIHIAEHQIDLQQKLYIESIPALLGLSQRATFNASSILDLKTDHPIAAGSNDHINPDSTTEGVSRPTLFVQNCISVLGADLKCLDLGSGAAGLVFEYAMNGVLAVGIDGSDFCRLNRIGYWPLLPNNLFTCDITKPFSFLSRDTHTLIHFNVITAWEVLEHIAECDLPALFNNVTRHLDEKGYFIGSISLVEYLDGSGNPYHVTLRPRDWWKAKFIESGLVMLDTPPFNESLFCRGNGPRFQDFHNYARNPNEGFWFVAQSKSNSAPQS